LGIDRPKRHDTDGAADHTAKRYGTADHVSPDRLPGPADALRERAERWSRRGYAAQLRGSYDWRQLEDSWTRSDLTDPPEAQPQEDSRRDIPAARRAEWQGPLARAEVERIGDGIVDERQRPFPAAERRIADFLAAADGCSVAARAEDHGIRARKPDADVDGVPTEFKSLRPGATDATVRGALNSAKGQAGSAVLDARDSGLTEAGAWHGVRRFLSAPYSGKVDAIRVIGDGYDLKWKRG
jgi:Contact-dependent growth inhibition CdiA C-terminal domain